MDPVTHYVITRRYVGNERTTIVAGLLADTPFYLTYPFWLIRRKQLRVSLQTNEWPAAPNWMYQLHYITHSIPVVGLLGIIFYFRRRAWPKAVTAWLLHILIDIPTHSRKNWAPAFLWPFSNFTVDGISWPELLINVLKRNTR